MKHAFIHKQGSPRLLLIFAGWGMDQRVFEHLRRPGYDIMAVWDYTLPDMDWSCVDSYAEICVMAWSMGVYAASQTLRAIAPRITKCVAVGGTMHPVHDTLGIPEAVFNGTLQGLSEASLRKFNRRMCGTAAMQALFAEHAPQRTVDDLRAELQAIADSTANRRQSAVKWDLAIVGQNDMIFPARAQQAAWQQEGVAVQLTDDAHFMDFSALANRLFIDKELLAERFGAGTATYDSNAAVQVDVLERLDRAMHSLGLDRAVMQAENTVLEIGSGSGMLSRRIARYVDRATLRLWDIAAACPQHLPIGRNVVFEQCDAETAIAHLPAESVDMIFSSSTVQWFNSPARFLDNCHRVLRPGGMAVITTFTKGNLHQISDITGHGLPLLSGAEWASLTEPLFQTVFTEEYERDLDFDTPLQALRHLKLTGVNSLGRTADTTVNTREVLRCMQPLFDGRYHLTYKPLIMILKKI